MLAGDDVEAELGHRGAEPARVGLQGIAKVGGTFEKVQCGQRSSRDHRTQGIAEQIGSRALAEQFHDLASTTGVATTSAAERLAQRASEDVDSVHDLAVLMGATTGLAHEADGV